MTRLEETLSRLNNRTHGLGEDDPLLKQDGEVYRTSDVLILMDAHEHLAQLILELLTRYSGFAPSQFLSRPSGEYRG